MSHISDYQSVINVNDFDIGSQISLENSLHCSVSIIDSLKKSINNNKYNGTNNKITPFSHSSISITKIKPRTNQNFISVYNSTNNENNSNKRVQLLSNSVKKEQYPHSSSTLQKVKYNGIIKLRNSTISKNELTTNYLKHSPKNLNDINDVDYYIGS